VEPFLGLPERVEAQGDSPLLLSETQAFASLAALEAAPGVIPYSVVSPLWSDGARKLRWLALPSGSQVGFSEAGAWAFPEGTVLIKHFGMALDERTPEVVRRLETRFLVAAEGGGYYGLVYRWDDDQRDARLANDGGEELLEIVGGDGSVRQQRYTYPSAQACRACHSSSTGFVMGVRTAQLNGDHDYGDGTGPFNQLAVWSAHGIFDTPVGDIPPDERQRLASLDDDSVPLETRVRSYWDSNCSSCHNGDPAIPSWDARFSTPLAEQRVIAVDPYTGARPDGVRLIVPGDPERSLIYLRSRSTEAGVRMPPLLKNRVDERYVERLGEWIASMPAR
jgi:uncharacterized repeat protein (TIGR03806 family)